MNGCKRGKWGSGKKGGGAKKSLGGREKLINRFNQRKTANKEGKRTWAAHTPVSGKTKPSWTLKKGNDMLRKW